jgi:hypothetical protein
MIQNVVGVICLIPVLIWAILFYLPYLIVKCMGCDKNDNFIGDFLYRVSTWVNNKLYIQDLKEIGQKLIFEDNIPRKDYYFLINNLIIGMNKNESISQR